MRAPTTRVEVLEDVPDSELKRIVESFRADGANEVLPQLQTNGAWTVRAFFDPNAKITVQVSGANVASTVQSGNIEIKKAR